MQTDIFIVDRKSEHLFDIQSSNTLIKKLKTLKPKQKYEYIIYVHNNLHLIVNIKNKNKTCEKVEVVSTSIGTLNNNNIMYITSKITNVPLEYFPIINSYNKIINRVVTVYDGNLCLVQESQETDKSNKSKEIISFIRVENDINVAQQLVDKLN